MKASHWYVVQGSDTTMMPKAAASFGQKNCLSEYKTSLLNWYVALQNL